MIGGYAVILLINRIGLVAFRDPNGIRPLCYGSRSIAGSKVKDYAVASESCAIDALHQGFVLQRDVAPGKILLLILYHFLSSSLPFL